MDLEEKAAEGPSSEASLVGLLVGNLFEMDNTHFFRFRSYLTLRSSKSLLFFLALVDLELEIGTLT